MADADCASSNYPATSPCLYCGKSFDAVHPEVDGARRCQSCEDHYESSTKWIGTAAATVGEALAKLMMVLIFLLGATSFWTVILGGALCGLVGGSALYLLARVIARWRFLARRVGTVGTCHRPGCTVRNEDGLVISG